jgi:LPS sulfotransferase NodH
MEKFIILTTQRSGSTFFRLYLNSHENIRCHDEVFLRSYGAKDGWNNFIKDKNNLNNDKTELKIVYDYLESLFYNKNHSAPWTDIDSWNDYLPQAKENVQAVGFKFMYDQFQEHPYIEEWLKKEQIKIIHFYRKNKLKMELSRLSAQKSGIYHSQKTIARQKHQVDTTKIVNNINKYNQIEEDFKLRYQDNDYLEIDYETFLEDPETINNCILDFLSIKGNGFYKPKLNKLNPNNVRDIVSNYDELESSLKKANLEWMLSD